MTLAPAVIKISPVTVCDPDHTSSLVIVPWAVAALTSSTGPTRRVSVLNNINKIKVRLIERWASMPLRKSACV